MPEQVKRLDCIIISLGMTTSYEMRITKAGFVCKINIKLSFKHLDKHYTIEKQVYKCLQCKGDFLEPTLH